MATLIIRLHEDHTKEVMYFGEDGTLQQCKPVKAFSEITDNDIDQLIILLPGTCVHMLSVTLPPMSHTELQQAVPNILEEKLAQDITQSYFSIGDADADNKRSIAVIEQILWDTLLSELKRANLSATVIMPDYLALPFVEDSWTIFCEAQYALLRLSTQNGLACDTALANAMLSLKLEEATTPPNSIKLICDPNSPTPQIERVSSENTSTHTFAELVDPQQLIHHPTFNMLERQLRKKKQTHRSYWYWSGVCFASLIAVFFLGQVALYIDFKIQSKNVNQALLSTYQKVFPGTTALEQPRFRIEQELREYELEPNPFIRILERIGHVKAQDNAITINTLSYTNGKLTLVIIANTNSALNQFNQQLSNAGLKITSNQTDTVAKQLNETLTVELL